MSTPAAFESAIKSIAKSGSDFMEVGVYLLHRLEELGVKSLFGVPGDFNLGFLDLVEDYPGIDWIGNCNELDAAYAADGYARIKVGSIGAVLTTYGVGELSAINGIAGAYAELVPVAHIAGFPSKCSFVSVIASNLQGQRRVRYHAYAQAAELVTYSQTILNDQSTAAAEIDRVLSDCVIQSRPVYIALPTDIAHTKISSERLQIPLPRIPAPNSASSEAAVVEEIVKLIEESQGDVAILVDVGTVRHNTVDEVKAFVEKTGFEVYASPMGKSIVSEQHERYGGLYVGLLTRPEIKNRIEDAKLIISIGAVKSDLNTGNFTTKLETVRTIELHHATTKVKFAEYPGIGMKYLLPKLTAALPPLSFKSTQSPLPKWIYPVPQESTETISQSWLWPRIGQFLRPRDVVVAETGTSAFGVLDIPFPEEAVFVSQILWGSIGWTVGSTLGAALAVREKGSGRTILFIGDGSLQLTVQELSTMLREGLKPIVFILNNNGYTIERAIRGETRKYNDVSNWDYTTLMKALGDVDGTRSKSYLTKTKTELDTLLHDEVFAAANLMQVIEIRMDKMDMPYVLKHSNKLVGVE
ncbi:hypothetical protein D9757_001403 [Collybiopsis confluens]|uniref:Pyruvate decarboxylase n=1 Tax=Collybiopsis confluens TaxID=2823264 RepID=A0A8H5HZP4_9AGAR|nr:hypothetical protein D9757_001403 [Collybiopsis confluens]